MIDLTKTVKALIIANCAVFILSFIFFFVGFNITDEFALFPIWSNSFQWHQFLTHLFIHAGFTHIIFNMLFLASFGPLVEDWVGDRKFLILYLLCGFGAALTNMMLSGSDWRMVGASGAVFGILTYYTLLYPNHIIRVLGLVPVKTKWLFGFIFFSEFFMACSFVEDGIGHFAHVGGVISSVFVWIIFEKKPIR